MAALKTIIKTMPKYWFPAMLIIALISYIIVIHIEERTFYGPTITVRDVVEKAVFVAGGTLTGRSFTRIILRDGRSYRMPLDEMVPVDQGDYVVLRVPLYEFESGESDVRVLEYCISAANSNDCSDFD